MHKSRTASSRAESRVCGPGRPGEIGCTDPASRPRCCGTPLSQNGSCILCDVTLSSPPHVCLRWLTIIGDEDGCASTFHRLDEDHETMWRLDRIDGSAAHEGAGSCLQNGRSNVNSAPTLLHTTSARHGRRGTDSCACNLSSRSWRPLRVESVEIGGPLDFVNSRSSVQIRVSAPADVHESAPVVAGADRFRPF